MYLINTRYSDILNTIKSIDMKNNRLTIDLDRLEIGIETAYTIQEIKQAQVPERCTLTEAVEKFSSVQVFSRDEQIALYRKKDVEQFKSQYLDKEETLEDGVYTAKIREKSTPICWFIKNGEAYHDNWLTIHWGKATDLINPVKIAEI